MPQTYKLDEEHFAVWGHNPTGVGLAGWWLCQSRPGGRDRFVARYPNQQDIDSFKADYPDDYQED